MKLNRGQIFNFVVDGRFFAIAQLPEAEGDTSKFDVICISAEKGMTPIQFEKKFITALGDKPKRDGVSRYQQFKTLVEKRCEGGKSVVFITKNAELLTPKALRIVKPMSEASNKSLEASAEVGFIFEGNMSIFKKVVAKEKDIELRMDIKE
jgi:hypothetical protein